jgi:hypothetical protein
MSRSLRALLFIALVLMPLLAAAAPRAWLDRDSVRLGETVTLNVETDARGAGEPDFSVLDAQFRRLGTSSSTQLSYSNGRQSARTLWAVALEPRAEGTIAIPSFTVGAETTEPLVLNVLPMPAGGSAAAGDDVFLEIDAEPASPYVQQQVRYTVRLYYAVTLLEGQLQEPQTTGAQVRRLGQDVNYNKTIGDRRYSVVERRYALVPEASGRLEIPGPQFAGRALRSGSYGSMLGANSVLNARGNAVTLDVRPRPAGAKTPWLPARALELSDESGETPAELQVGEPLTLTLRLHAQGLSAEQLPELTLPAIDGAEVYPDQETPQTRDDGEWLRGERVRKFALVPTRPGTLTLPEVAIDWWNVGTDQAERAVLPARTFTVAGAVPGAAAVDTTAPQDAGGEPATESPASAATTTRWPNYLWPTLTVLFATLWIATLLVRRRNAAREAIAPTPSPIRAQRSDWRPRWNAALQAADLTAAAHAIVDAARDIAPQARALADVLPLLGADDQRAALQRLERVLYRGEDAAGLVEILRAAFTKGPHWRRDAAAVSADDSLPPLYPPR